jgi:hypothetical protein
MLCNSNTQKAEAHKLDSSMGYIVKTRLKKKKKKVEKLGASGSQL